MEQCGIKYDEYIPLKKHKSEILTLDHKSSQTQNFSMLK
jgi:hypothetical protein